MLSVLGVICGVTAVLAMLSIGEGAKIEVLNQIEQLGTKNIYIKAIPLTKDQLVRARERQSRGLSFGDVERIAAGCETAQNIAYLKEVTASIIGMIKEGSPQIVASSANYAVVQNLSVSQGRFLTDHDIRNKTPVCVLGDNIAQSFGHHGRPGNNVRIENQLYKIVGVLKRYDIKENKSSAISSRGHNDIIFIPWGTERAITQAARKTERVASDQLSEIVVQVHNIEQVTASARIVKRIVEKAHGGVEDYQMVVPQALLQQSQKTQRIFNIVLGAIAGISLLVGGIGIMNIMLATVSERRREIGLRRAVGATQKDIIVQFMTETVMLTFSGGLIGVGVGMGAVWLITTFAGWSTAVTAYAIALPLLTSILVGLFFGIYPAYHAAKMDPIVALQHN